MSSKYRNTPKGRIAPNGYRLCDPLPEGQVLIDSKKTEWTLGKPIGLGGFGEIYACHKKDDLRKYVMKLDNSSGPLFVEINFVLRACSASKIKKFKDSKGLDFLGMPQFAGSGNMKLSKGDYRFLVMDRLGEELQTVLESRRLSIRHTCNIACRIIDVLEFIHEQGYIHADIKAQNILRAPDSGKSSKRTNDESEDDKYYLIDYGLAERFIFQDEHKPYEADKRKANNGTVEFRSRDAHIGVISRRSDIESLGYNLILWFYGRHPWANMLKNADLVQEKKCWAMENIPQFLDEAFSDKPLDCISSSDSKIPKTSKSSVKSKKIIPNATTPPKGFERFFEEVNKMAHDTKPNYDKLKRILREIGTLNKEETPLNGSYKKSRLSNEVTPAKGKASKLPKKEDKVDVEKKGRRGRTDSQASLKKPIKGTKLKNGCNGQQDSSDNDETEIEDQSTDQETSVKPRKRGRPKKTVESKLGLLKSGVRSTKAALLTKGVKKLTNDVLALKTHNRVLSRTRSKSDFDSSDELTNGLSNKRKSPKSVTPLPVGTTRKYPRLSTPLIVASPSGSEDSPLFGPYELEESIKENRVVIPSSSGKYTSSHTDSESDDERMCLRVPSCRIYINDKRYTPVEQECSLASTTSNSSHHSSSTECYTPSSSSYKKLPNGVNQLNGKINGYASNSNPPIKLRPTRKNPRRLLSSKDCIFTETPRRVSNEIDTPAMRQLKLKLEKKPVTAIKK